jgi:hypothetical protein
VKSSKEERTPEECASLLQREQDQVDLRHRTHLEHLGEQVPPAKSPGRHLFDFAQSGQLEVALQKRLLRQLGDLDPEIVAKIAPLAFFHAESLVRAHPLLAVELLEKVVRVSDSKPARMLLGKLRTASKDGSVSDDPAPGRR